MFIIFIFIYEFPWNVQSTGFKSQSCCVHLHPIEIDWQGLNGDSQSCKEKNNILALYID